MRRCATSLPKVQAFSAKMIQLLKDLRQFFQILQHMHMQGSHHFPFGIETLHSNGIKKKKKSAGHMKLSSIIKLCLIIWRQHLALISYPEHITGLITKLFSKALPKRTITGRS